MRLAGRRTWLLLVSMMAAPALAPGQPAEVPGQSVVAPADLLSAAEARYNAAELDGALAEVSAYLAFAGLDGRQRVDGLLLRAYCHTAKGEDDAARRAIREAWEVQHGLEIAPDRVPPRFMWLYYDVMKELQVPVPPRTLAILYFTNNSTTDHAALQPLSQGIADILSTDFQSGSTEIQLVERERIDYILRELEMEKSDAFDQRTAVRVGGLVGAQYLLLGSFLRMDDDVRIDYRLVKTETAEILKGSSVRGRMRDLMELIEKLAASAAKEVGGAVDTDRSLHRGVDLGALMKYSEGLDLMDEQRYFEARVAFQAALDLAPEFELARSRVLQLNPVAQNAEGSNPEARQDGLR